MHKARNLFRSHQEIYRDANEGRQFDFVYAAMLVFGCLISLFGLLLNSPAVIIGAMLISPLMGPLLACGLALSLADWRIGSKAARNLALSIVETVLIAAVATWMSPLSDITPEITARTNPNLIDLLIALFSGTAGTLALASRRQAFTIIPGVAIATAVMPPLTTIGYGLSTRQFEVATGATMLFITNLTAIVLSAAVVFTFAGFRPREHLAAKPARLVRFRLPLAALVLVALAIPLMQTLTRAAGQTALTRNVREEFGQLVGTEIHASPSSLSVHVKKDDTAVIRAVLPTDKYISASKINSIRSRLENAVGHHVELHIDQVQLASAREQEPKRNADYVGGGAIKPPSVSPAPATELPRLHEELESRLCHTLLAGEAIQCKMESLEYGPAGARISISLRSPVALPTSSLSIAATSLSQWLRVKIMLDASVAIEGETANLEFGSSHALLSKSSQQKLEALRPTLQNESVHVQLTIDASDTSTTANKVRSLVAKSLQTSISRVDIQSATDTRQPSIALLQRLSVQSAPFESVDHESELPPGKSAQ